ncbi:MAG: SEC-C metal-binding domain-containing protein [Ktedonobacteraceae bacterium]
MFEGLKADIQHHIVDDLLKLLRGNITIKVQQPAPQRKIPRNLRTNVDDIARATGQAKSDGSDGTPRRPVSGAGTRGNARTNGAAPAPRQAQSNKIGRNDPCWCGSGKKYKKCHGA